MITLGTAHNGPATFPLVMDDAARARHIYVIGQTGSGKTVLFQNLIAQSLDAGEGLAFIDPHGDAALDLISQIHTARASHLTYFDLSDTTRPFGLNFMQGIDPERRPKAADDIVQTFIKIFGEEAIGYRSQWILRNAVRVLMDNKHGTLFAIARLITDKQYRTRKLQTCLDPTVVSFWNDIYDKRDKRTQDEWVSPILNKLDTLFSFPAIRHILGQPQNTIDLKRIMDERRILVVNLAKGQFGEGPAHLMGALIVSALSQIALARAEIPEQHRVPFYLYCDEFQNFATPSFSLILSEARKYRLALTLAHQFTGQIPDELREAVFGNVGTMIAFRVGATDADLIGKQFGDPVDQFKNLPNYTALVRTLKDGAPGNVVRLTTNPPPLPLHGHSAKLIENSRRRFGTNREEVEHRLARFMRSRDGRTV